MDKNSFPFSVVMPRPIEASRIAEIQFAYQCAEEIKDSCRDLFEVIRSSLDQLRQKRRVVNDRLCDSLAKKGSLRKKDYENMMDEIHVILDEKEQNAREEISSFLQDQKAFALTLRELMLGAVDFSSPELAARSRQLRTELAWIAEEQEQRKRGVIKRLTDFQVAHSRIIAHLESLLNNNEGIRCKDIKEVRCLVDREWGIDRDVRS